MTTIKGNNRLVQTLYHQQFPGHNSEPIHVVQGGRHARAFDILAKEIDTVETFEAAVELMRQLEDLTDRIDEGTLSKLLTRRNPVAGMKYIFSLLR